MENRTLLESLLIKYIHGKLTISERSQFNDLLADDVNEAVFKNIVYRHINEFNEENSISDKSVDFDGIYNNIILHLDYDHYSSPVNARRSAVLKSIINVTAAAAVLAGSFLLGRVIPDRHSGINIPDQLSYTEVKAPYGSKSEIRLPDGTIVMLNAGSFLKYSNDYNSSNRDISLKGEAYFKVVRNEQLPLIVNAGSISIKALGTEFNVKAYDEERTIETTLVEGKVEISSKIGSNENEKVVNLAPNQKAVFLKDEENFILEKMKVRDSVAVKPLKAISEKIIISPKINVDQVVAWTTGRLIFRGETLENLCIELERMYDVKIMFINNDIKKYRFTGVLLDETLEQVLNVIKLTAPISYTLDGKTVYLHSDTRKIGNYSRHMK